MDGGELISAAPFPPLSRLNPGVDECLSALHCLPYFIQYLEHCKSIKLLHFLFACETFKEVASSSPDLHSTASCATDCKHQLGSPTKSVKSNLQHDALDIYIKFISMNASHSINLPENVRQDIENQISTEDGAIDHLCFDPAVDYIKQCLTGSFVTPFTKSSHGVSYQLDVLNQDVCLADILLYDVTLVVFMEYLESKKSENHVLFWVSVEAFQQHLKDVGRSTTMEQVSQDAIALYSTYLSMQAIKPVNYGRIIRSIVESSISPDDGIITPDAFLIAQQYCYHYMDKHFFKLFLKSDQYKKFLRVTAGQLSERRKDELNIRNASSSNGGIRSQDCVTKMQSLSVQDSSPSASRKTTPSSSRASSPVSSRKSSPGPCTPVITSSPKKEHDSEARESPQRSIKSSPALSSKHRAESSSSLQHYSDVVINGPSPDASPSLSHKLPKPEYILKDSDPLDSLDDPMFWKMPTCDYTLGLVDQWGVYQTEDKHLLDTPTQGSEKIKKSVLKLFGKEEMTEEAAMAQAKSIIADVMNQNNRSMDMNELLNEDL